MKTIAFDRQNFRTVPASSPVSRDDNYAMSEDIITIDSQIDLKVRGELPEVKALNTAAQFMEQKMSRYLQTLHDEFRSSHEELLAGTLNFEFRKKEGKALEALRQFHLQKFSALAELKTKGRRSNKFLYSIQPGLEIITPPHDNELTNSFASYASANKILDNSESFPLDNGYGASGMALFLSSVHDLSVRLSVHCPVSYAWSNFVGEGGGYVATQGGLAIAIYDASEGTLVRDKHETLWNQSGRRCDMQLSGGGDETLLQNTTIADNHFEMKAGHTYLIWLWCWSFAGAGDNAAAFANIDCKVPFVIVDSSSLQ